MDYRQAHRSAASKIHCDVMETPYSHKTNFDAAGVKCRCTLCPEDSETYLRKQAKRHVLNVHGSTREIRRHPKKYIKELTESRISWMKRLSKIWHNNEEKEEKTQEKMQTGRSEAQNTATPEPMMQQVREPAASANPLNLQARQDPQSGRPDIVTQPAAPETTMVK